VACGLLQMGRAADNGSLVSLAADWIRRAEADANELSAFRNDDLGIHSGTVGETTPYYTVSGVHAMRFPVSAATADATACVRGLQAYVEASNGQPKGIDLTLGRAATPMGCALLLD
jgi:hypothetical protein